MAAILMALTGMYVSAAGETQFQEGYILPNSTIQDLFSRDKNFATLNEMSPGGNYFLIPQEQELSSLDLMTQRTYRLAMLEFCPDVNREWRLSTYGVSGLKIYSLQDRSSRQVQLPENVFISHMTWSPDGKQIAFLVHLKQGSQVWTADVATGQARALSQQFVMATVSGRGGRGGSSRMIQWTPNGSILTLLVPADRGPEPQAGAVPSTPIIRRTREKPTPTRTLPFLLRTPHDQALFKYYTTSQLAELSAGQPPRKIGAPAMYTSVSSSPDGKYVLAEKIEEPFSYIVDYSDFPRHLIVMDQQGQVLSTVRETPLQEAQSSGGDQGAGANLPRDVEWRPDGQGLSFLMREKRQEGAQQEDSESTRRKDQLMLLAPPFDMAAAKILVSSEKRLSQVSYSRDGRYAFATLAGEGKQEIVAYDLGSDPPATHVLAKSFDSNDPLKLPGQIMTQSTGNGISYALLSGNGSSAYLQGPGYAEDYKPQPFIDRVAIATGDKVRVFEGSKEMWEQPLVPLDADMKQIIISRETKSTFPDSYLWSADTTPINLTQNRDPFPEITAAKRVDFEFTRRDGTKINARISFPVGYREGTRVPAVFWTYPNEFSSAEDYRKSVIRGRRSVPNYNSFSHLSYLRWSDIWLTQGYAVVYPDVPIVGKGNTFNDNFVPHLVDTIYAAIRKVDEMGWVDIDRIGHGGHSYGAFTTANLLAHTPFFKAGIAGDGAYNRSLTPMAFQGERRFIWEAPSTYLNMSPFFAADHINTPLLMYHGEQDNNSGTFLIQSERMIQALTGLGKTAVLYIYPFESHGPVCRESYLDLWARWVEWFDTYVKKEAQVETSSNR